MFTQWNLPVSESEVALATCQQQILTVRTFDLNGSVIFRSESLDFTAMTADASQPEQMLFQDYFQAPQKFGRF